MQNTTHAPQPPGYTSHQPPRHPLDRLTRLGIVILCLIVTGQSLDRALRGRYDFHHFYLDARYVWTHHALNENLTNPNPDLRRQLPFYLPTVSVTLAPVAAFGRIPAALIWSTAQLSALIISLLILRRWGRHTAHAPPLLPFGLTILIAAPAFLEAGKFNQLSYFVLALILAGWWAVSARRAPLGGALLAIAAVVKLLPAIFLIWLVLKRKWTAVIAFCATAALAIILPPLIAFGPARTIEYHRQWWAYNIAGDSARGMLNPDLPEHFIDRRNQSIPQVLARLTWPDHPHAAPCQPIHLSPQTCTRLGYTIAGVLFLALLWATRRPWNQLSERRNQAEFAAYAIGMLVFSPLLRQYYLVWALPALLLLAHKALVAATARRRTLGRAGVAIWIAGMLLWIWPTARELGAHLLMLIALAALTLSAIPPTQTDEPAPTPAASK